MSSPRLRRLAADYQAVRGEFSGHPHVRVEPLGPQRPPEAYRVTLRVRGLVLDGDTPRPVDEHVAEIRLPLGYPREKPLVRPLTPVFHPNIRDEYCIQDYWAAGQSLVDTIAKLADMLQYQIFNSASPLDALAARWAQQNAHLFPLGNVTLGTPDIDVVLGARSRPPTASAEDPVPVASAAVLAPVSAPDAAAPLAGVDADEEQVIMLKDRG